MAEVRLIGVEIRLRDSRGGQEELALIPADVRIPARREAWNNNRRLNLTIHTSHGDLNCPVDFELNQIGQ